MVVGDNSLERVSSVVVARGLHVLRYTSAEASEAPIALVRPAAGSDGTIEVIGAPGSVPGQLDSPGSCLVVVAHSAGALEVSVRRRRRGGSLEATLHLEPLAVSRPAEPSAVSGQDNSSQSGRAQGLNGEDRGFVDRSSIPKAKFIAHIARRGDVTVGDGEWAAGPEAPAQIEGLEFHRSELGEADIEVQVLTAGTNAWTNWAEGGTFVGTRGRALPLVGVRLRGVGGSFEGSELVADALFLGSAISKKRGREVEFVGAFGTDPLVGLRVTVQKKTAQSVAALPGIATPRVRVFRAGGVNSGAA